MPFRSLLDSIAAHRRHVIVYAPDDTGTDLADALATRNLTVDHRRIPSLGADAFAVIREGDRFYGAISLSDLL